MISSATSSSYGSYSGSSSDSSGDERMVPRPTGSAFASSSSGEVGSATYLCELDPATINLTIMDQVKRMEMVLRNGKLLNFRDHPNFDITETDGSVIARAHKSILFFNSPYFQKAISSGNLPGTAMSVASPHLPVEVYQKVIEWIYLPDAERRNFLDDEAAFILDHALHLATQWELKDLREQLEILLVNSPLALVPTPLTERRDLEEIYDDLETEGIHIEAADRQWTLRQKILRIAIFGAAVLFGSYQTYGHYHSAKHGAEEVTAELAAWSQVFGSMIMWSLVLGNLFSHLFRDTYYIDRSMSYIFENQLISDESDIPGQVAPQLERTDSRCCTRHRMLDVGHKSLAVVLGTLSLAPSFYKSFVTNPQFTGWASYAFAGSTTVLKAPEYILNYFLMLRLARQRFFGRKDSTYEGPLQMLKRRVSEILVPENLDGQPRWKRVLLKIKHIGSAALLFPPHMIIEGTMSYLSFSTLPLPLGITLTGISLLSDVYLRLCFPMGKVREPRFQTLQRPRTVRYLRNAAMLSVPLLSWSASITDVEKTIGKLTNIAGLITAFKVCNVLYMVSFEFGAIPTATRHQWQESVTLWNADERERTILYRQLNRAIRHIEEAREKQEEDYVPLDSITTLD